MANHRLSTPAPSWLQLLSPAYLRRLSLGRKSALLWDLLWLGAVVPAAIWLIAASPTEAAIGLVLGTLVRTVFAAVHAGRQQSADVRTEARNLDMLESLAAHPGGAPLVADVRSHCGCILRYAFNGEDNLWAPVAVVEADHTCLAEAR